MSVNSASNSYSFTDMQRLVRLMNGEQPGLFKSAETAAPEANDGMRDVIVLRADDDLLKGVPTGVISQQVADDLKARGAQVDEQFKIVPGASARIDAATEKALTEAGYQVFDNSERSLIPGFPSKTWTGNFEMPNVDSPRLVRSDVVNAQGFTGKNQVVAVIDSGFQKEGVELVAWKDVVDGSPEPIDPVGHGTHCAGDVRATAPDAKLVAIRVMNEEGAGRPSDIIRGIQWAIQNKQKYNISVINLSLGGPPDDMPSSLDPVNRAVEMAISRGIVVVSAAGNKGPGKHTIGSPADDPLGITVGAALDRKTVSDFSSRGPTDDGLEKPDVMAPGEFILSWNVPGSQMDQIGTVVEAIRAMNDAEIVELLTEKPEMIEGLGLPENIFDLAPEEREELVKSKLPPIFKPNEESLAAPGTSFAAPTVAGVIATMREANPKAAPQTIKDALLSTAEDMGEQYGTLDEGHGFVNAEKAVAKVRQNS